MKTDYIYEDHNHCKLKTDSNGISISYCSPGRDYNYFLPRNYNYVLAKDLDIFKNIAGRINKIRNTNVKNLSHIFMSEFNGLLFHFSRQKNFINPLPDLTLTEVDSESVLYEWKFYDFRFGFLLDANELESYWYLVSNRKLRDLNMSGDFTSKDIKPILLEVIIFVMENT